MQAPVAPHSFSNSGSYRPSTLAKPSSQLSSITGPPPFGAGGPPPGVTTYGNHGGYHPPYTYGGYRPRYYSSSVYLVPGWLNYGFYGGPYDSGYPDESGAAQQSAAAAPEYPAPDTLAEVESPPPYSPPARPAYQPQAESTDQLEQPQVTLVFKDGRPPQQVQNYALTPTTLYVLDGVRRREIPLNDLNLPLTEKTNREAGVDFVVPAVAD